MSVAKRAAKQVQHVANAARLARYSSLLKYTYHPVPDLDSLILPMTKDILSSEAHPYHHRTVERLKAFDLTKFYYSVSCPITLSSKKIIRQWATNRVKKAIAHELARRGLDKLGQPIPLTPNQSKETESETTTAVPMKGSAHFHIQTNPLVLTADNAFVRECVGWVFEKIDTEKDGNGIGGTSAAAQARDDIKWHMNGNGGRSFNPLHRPGQDERNHRWNGRPYDNATNSRQRHYMVQGRRFAPKR